MLRRTLIWIIGLSFVAALLAIAGGVAGWTSMPVLFGCWLLFQLAILLAAFLIERVAYKPLLGVRPGPGWEATAERFVDPATGVPVQVWYNAATGERRYITTGV